MTGQPDEDVRIPDCLCGHPKYAHLGTIHACQAEGCLCRLYRPDRSGRDVQP